MTTGSSFYGHSEVVLRPDIFDFETFDHLTMGEMLLQREVIELFRQQVHATLLSLQGTPVGADLKSLMHTLRGASAAVGATQITAFARVREEASSVVLVSEAGAELSGLAKTYFEETDRILAPRFRFLDEQRRRAG
jgi:HPt (histidine-containing phosphotransfer) domain-containing protein